MSDANGAADDAVQDDPIEVTGVPPTLEQVHQLNQAKVEQEDEAAADDEDGEDDSHDDKGTGAEDDQDGGAGDDDADDSNDDADDGEDDADEPAEEKPAPAPAEPDQPAAELDTDPTKNVGGKVAIKALDGKTYYYNTLDELPDDFEPATYKGLIRAGKDFERKERDDQQTAEDAEAKAQVAADKERTDAMQQSWDNDIKGLVDSGAFPKDAAKREVAEGEVYDYIEAEMKKGNVLTSFGQAYKGMMYDKQQAADAKTQKELNDAKKKRGGIVQSGSAGTETPTTNRRGKVIEAPPVGVGLDAVHRRALGQL